MGIGFFLWNTEAISTSLSVLGMLRNESANLSLKQEGIADLVSCFHHLTQGPWQGPPMLPVPPPPLSESIVRNWNWRVLSRPAPIVSPGTRGTDAMIVYFPAGIPVVSQLKVKVAEPPPPRIGLPDPIVKLFVPLTARTVSGTFVSRKSPRFATTTLIAGTPPGRVSIGETWRDVTATSWTGQIPTMGFEGVDPILMS